MRVSLQEPSWLGLVKEESAGAGSKRNREGEGEGVGLGLDKPLDFLATSEERFPHVFSLPTLGTQQLQMFSNNCNNNDTA